MSIVLKFLLVCLFSSIQRLPERASVSHDPTLCHSLPILSFSHSEDSVERPAISLKLHSRQASGPTFSPALRRKTQLNPLKVHTSLSQIWGSWTSPDAFRTWGNMKEGVSQLGRRWRGQNSLHLSQQGSWEAGKGREWSVAPLRQKLPSLNMIETNQEEGRVETPCPMPSKSLAQAHTQGPSSMSEGDLWLIAVLKCRLLDRDLRCRSNMRCMNYMTCSTPCPRKLTVCK